MPMDKMAIDLEELQDYQIHWYADPNANELNMYCKMYSDYKEYQNVIYISFGLSKSIFQFYHSVF